LRFGGDFVLDSQCDQQLVFAHGLDNKAKTIYALTD
jgi:hypothetical protein